MFYVRDVYSLHVKPTELSKILSKIISLRVPDKIISRNIKKFITTSEVLRQLFAYRILQSYKRAAANIFVQ